MFKFFSTLIILLFCNVSYAQNPMLPLSSADITNLDNPFTLPWTPVLTKLVDGRPVILGVISFDGTWNDKYKLSPNERETIEGHIFDILQGNSLINIRHYYRGVGTQSNIFLSYLDGAVGYSVKNTSESAAKTVVTEVARLRDRHPDADVRLLVSGFSRGGAAARHFMNTFDKYWKSEPRVGSNPKFYAIIFDTVQSQLVNNLDMSISVNADIFYHFVSEDERRVFFKSVVDDPQNDSDKRVVTILRPGVHSDVGSSYPNGIGSEYIADVDVLLSGMGLLHSNQCQKVMDDARSQGKNDSRWLVDRILGIPAPNVSNNAVNRNSINVRVPPLSEVDRQDWHKRILELQFSNGVSRRTCKEISGYILPRFIVTRSDNKFNVTVGPSNYFWDSIINISGGKYILKWTTPVGTSLIEIPQEVIQKIGFGKEFNLDLRVIIDLNNEANFSWFVDNVRYGAASKTFHK